MRDFYSDEIRHDPSYVQWEAYIVESDGNPTTEKKTLLKTRDCTDDDFNTMFKGYPTIEANKAREKKFRQKITRDNFVNSALCIERKKPDGSL